MRVHEKEEEWTARRLIIMLLLQLCMSVFHALCGVSGRRRPKFVFRDSSERPFERPIPRGFRYARAPRKSRITDTHH
jgi:hypothetical protein